MKEILAVCSNSIHKKTFSEIKNYAVFSGKKINISLIEFTANEENVHHFSLQSLINLKKKYRTIKYLYKTFLYVYFTAEKQIENKLNTMNPECILLGNDTGHYERALIRIAKRKKIPTILHQDGLLFDQTKKTNNRFKHRIFLNYQKYIARYIGGVKYGYGGCDAFFALGPYWQDIVLHYNQYLYKKIAVVSSPYFESFITPPQTHNHEDNKLDFCMTYFLTNFLSGLNDSQAHELQCAEIKQLYVALNKQFTGQFRLILKIHPEDSLSCYQSLTDECPKSELTINKSLETIFKESNLCITNFSSVFIQAFFNNSFCMLSNIMLKNTRYESFILSLQLPILNSIDDFVTLIQQQKEQPNNKELHLKSQKQILRFIDFNPNHSSNQRIIEQIDKLECE